MSRQAVLFTPGDERRMVEKSLESPADMVILDIEDAVAPSEKTTACNTVREVLNERDPADIEVEVTVRINPIEDRGAQDVDLLSGAADRIENLVLPKVRGTDELDELVETLEAHDFEAGLMPLIETPLAIANLHDIAGYPGVEAMEFGAEDFTTEIGGVNTDERDEVLYARQKVVVAGAAHDVDAIDMAWPDFRDVEGLRHNTEQAVRMGFDGKSAIHPSQIEVIKDVYRPSEEQVEWAREVVEEAEQAAEEGKVVFQLEGEMIDPPIIARAEDVLKRYEAA